VVQWACAFVGGCHRRRRTSARWLCLPSPMPPPMGPRTARFSLPLQPFPFSFLSSTGPSQSESPSRIARRHCSIGTIRLRCSRSGSGKFEVVFLILVCVSLPSRSDLFPIDNRHRRVVDCSAGRNRPVSGWRRRRPEPTFTAIVGKRGHAIKPATECDSAALYCAPIALLPWRLAATDWDEIRPAQGTFADSGVSACFRWSSSTGTTPLASSRHSRPHHQAIPAFDLQGDCAIAPPFSSPRGLSRPSPFNPTLSVLYELFTVPPLHFAALSCSLDFLCKALRWKPKALTCTLFTLPSFSRLPRPASSPIIAADRPGLTIAIAY
jgi:hypothetical protein